MSEIATKIYIKNSGQLEPVCMYCNSITALLLLIREIRSKFLLQTSWPIWR